MNRSEQRFGELSVDEFLAEYWQKRPLLVRGAFAGFENPIRPGELAGLALEDGVASRLILERGEHPWELRLAPHAEGTFESLPETHWTLLVHEVDQWIPAVGRLLERFRFLPNWRLDDVMVSYAPPDGSVGAHLDHYDVFLLQGLGRRRWQIEDRPRPAGERNVPDLDVRMLLQFDPDEEWVLEPGDMLYLPPRFPHLGVAIDACMTFSIGFRAPQQKELAAAFGADLTERADAGLRYADPDLTAREEPGEIDGAMLRRVRAVLDGIDRGDDALAGWFGRFATEPKRERPDPEGDLEWTPARLREAWTDPGFLLERAAPARFAHYRHADGSVSLFVGGESQRLSGSEVSFAPLITGAEPLDASTLAAYASSERLLECIGRWIHHGYLFVPE
ncbi:MAG: cupin domain-containing protein [Acidobacteria bacterium]|nr:cupin domain-containing protein [Acidobacteriota bacterium]NIM63820.1 cupin domain-containing protein [Acidobacteriota bacterium]NIO59754.1 cupin domain-containing protein [Acidobacteriota bacterium]NIQ30837.1 cupin domain-containing protein [Acidobacteriota bacterium]NIQ85910.1 cupin domain-containing protein [Acidobacteriota bacterium]